MNIRPLIVLLISAAFLSQPPSPISMRRPGLREQIEQISRASRGRVGASVMLLETGEAVAFNGDERFPMQSVYKLPIGMTVLRQVHERVLGLDGKVRVEVSDLVPSKAHSPLRDKYPKGGIELSVGELLRSMLVESDGTACDVLLRLIGG